MVVDETVWEIYGDQMSKWALSQDLKLEPIIAPGNEDQKTMETFTFLLDELKRVDPLRRSEPVLAVGGGVVTDTVGFACACWRRGVPWCRLPTTLLGIVDASVGIKVAINYHRKNGVGHFFSPIHTFIDTSFLGSVPLPDIRSGVGEIMKAALIHDERLWELMEAHGEQMIAERFQHSDAAAQVFARPSNSWCPGPPPASPPHHTLITALITTCITTLITTLITTCITTRITSPIEIRPHHASSHHNINTHTHTHARTHAHRCTRTHTRTHTPTTRGQAVDRRYALITI